MASEAQVLANRSNAQKSTGPRTPEGKAVVAQNAVRHGLLAREVVIKGEDPGEFEFYRAQMLGELVPVGSVESVLAERVVSLSWRLQRAERLQGAAFEALNAGPVLSPLEKRHQSMLAKVTGQRPSEPGSDELAFGRMVVKDFSDGRVLDRLLMYERRIEHSLYRTMAELQRQRLLQELDLPTEGSAVEAVSVGSTGIPFTALRAGLPVNLDHGRDAHATETPYGVTTNVLAADDQSCETNPICAGPNEGQVPCGTGVMSDSSQDGPEKTDPILRGEEDAGWSSPPSPDGDRIGWDREQTESCSEQANVV